MIWYFDSGASRHITSRKDLFSSLDAAPAGKKVTCANNASYPIKDVGKILITISDGSDLCLPDVLYVPRIKKNLLSVSSLAKNGLRVIFEDDRCIVRDRENGYSLITTGCVLGKMHRFAFSQDGSVRATRKLQLVHSDVCGPMRMPSVGNSLYFVTFIDDFSKFCWVYPLKAKSDVFAIFQHYVSMVENETGCKVQTLRTDRGGEYMSGAFKDFLGKKGIKHQCTMPYTLQQNGVAERKNRSLMEMARCMLKAKSFPHKLWMEAVACAAHVLNRCPTRALKTITPYESWYDRKPSISYLRVFGCLAYAHIPQQLRGKLDDKAVKCIFVGYSSGSKGYRLYNPATNKIFESRDVIFAETTAQPMVAFDVPHMQTQNVFEGFLPSFVENQESQQVDNFDQSFDQHVTPHDVEEIVREEQEVLREERTLPKWVQKTLQDSKLDAPLPWKTRAAHPLYKLLIEFKWTKEYDQAYEVLKKALANAPILRAPNWNVIFQAPCLEMNALITAWLPGTEGEGITDVIFWDYDFEERLLKTWFKLVEQLPMNVEQDCSSEPQLEVVRTSSHRHKEQVDSLDGHGESSCMVAKMADLETDDAFVVQSILDACTSEQSSELVVQESMPHRHIERSCSRDA
ncbi:hypothetical protein L7F22_048833 [Adiantum nelumboides]|nr:hypothetical protein [Adiantum nelumboides]